MLVRITAVALLAATFTTAAAHAQEEGVTLSDTAVERNDAEAADAVKSAVGVPVAPPHIEDEVAQLADEVGVSPLALQGAVNTVKAPPKTYLIHEGLIDPPAPPRPADAPARAAYGMWDRLAACESSGNWRINTGNGYFGGVQEDMSFWRRHGGTAFAARPDLATREQQIIVAERGLAAQGWGAWPRCSLRLGLR